MRGNRKIGIYLIATIIVAFITIGFAYLNASLSIVGSSQIHSSSWNVYWDNIQVDDGSVSGSQVTQEPTITNDTTVSFNVRLSKPGDFYEFTVDSVNDGTMDAMVSVVSGGAYESNGTTPKEIPSYLEYSLTYASGDSIIANDLLKIGWRKKYKVRVYFKEDINPVDLPSTPDSFIFKFSASYAQAVIPEVTDTIYWALQDIDNDNLNDKLILSNHQVSGVLSGNFAGDTVFEERYDVPWITDDYEVSSSVEIVEIEGTIAPKSTANWFYNIGYGASTSLTIDLDNLVTSHVTNMCGMFQYIGRYDLDFQIKGISKWDTSSVTDMSFMFEGMLGASSEAYSATPFSMDISEWDTSNVEDMSYMFGSTAAFTVGFELDLSKWNTSKVTNMASMFAYAGENAYTWNVGDLSEWDTSKVENMSNLFNRAGALDEAWNIGDLSNWNTSSVTNMSYLFFEAGNSVSSFELDLTEWDTSKVENMSWMFSKAGRQATTWSVGDISEWDTSKVTDMSHMFFLSGDNVTIFDLDLSGWDTSKVTNMNCMFENAGNDATTFNLDISNWDTSKVTDMSYMFDFAGYQALSLHIEGISDLYTSSVSNMKNMFYALGYNITSFELDLSGWDTSKVTNMSNMFASSGSNSSTWSIGDISGWDTSKVTNMSNMFNSAGYNATTFNLDLSGWNTSSVTDMSDMFGWTGRNSTTFNLDLSGWDTSSVTSMARMIRYAGYNATTWSITIPQTNGGGISNTTSTLYGKTTSVSALASSSKTGRTFTLASS